MVAQAQQIIRPHLVTQQNLSKDTVDLLHQIITESFLGGGNTNNSFLVM
jgi:hypothetical protein